MTYNELIKQEGEYTYSANVQFDIENDRKLLRFIPNETTVELLREYFIDIVRLVPAHHARILYGSYGTGKSHFLTVLSLLLGKTHTDGVAYDTFLARINEYDKHLAEDISNYILDYNRKPFLVVPIVFDFDDFDRNIYFSLKKKLDQIGMKISFKTFFDQALDLLELWKSNKESNDKLVNACDKAGIKLVELEDKLHYLDINSENIFHKVFYDMTYGVKFVYEVSNLSDVLNQVNHAISEDYTGVVFVFDEFGRYMEDNIKQIRVKAVQDLAEYCDHCEGNNHIILVSHKEIGLYTKKLGKSIISEWKKVEGRYKPTLINDKQDQCLSLIKNILARDNNVWKIFKKKFENNLNEMYSEASDFRGFLLDVARGENPFEAGFPLHPISLFALDRLSKKVAQNERTFFTYLASKEDGSLYSFLCRCNLDDFHYVGIDEIYDYFEPNIKSVQSDISYEWYRNLQKAMSKSKIDSLSNSPEIKILKVIATIGVIDDSSVLVANKATLLRVINHDKIELSEALNKLCEQRIIKYSGIYDRYEFFEASIFNVEAMIEDESKFIGDDAVLDTLNAEFADFVLYPHQYNREFKISRIFLPVFSSVSSNSWKTFKRRFGQFYDGVLIMLFNSPDDCIDDILSLSKDIDRSIIFANSEATSLQNAVKKYIAAKYLRSQKQNYISKDPSFEKELDYLISEIILVIRDEIDVWKNNYKENIKIYTSGNQCANITSFVDLSILASDISRVSYPETLIVNNELINKNYISGSMSYAKKIAVENILKGNSADEYYGLTPLSPEYIIVRSVLAKNGLIDTNDVDIVNYLPNNKKPQESIIKLFDGFISRARKESVSFSDLYITLKEKPYGLRDGYLSLLFAFLLVPHKKSLIISSYDTEQEITTDLFEEIVRRPDDFSFTLISWTRTQLDYLESLEQVFYEYINKENLNKNRMKAIFDGMLVHYKQIPKFTRTTEKYVSQGVKNYRKLIEKPVSDYSSFLFNKLGKIEASLNDTLDKLRLIKVELDDTINSLSQELIIDICIIFSLKQDSSLCDLIFDMYNTSWAYKHQKSFDYYTNAFLEIAHHISEINTDTELIVNLSKALTGIELYYWNDNHVDEFKNHLNEISNKLNTYNNPSVLNDGETKLTLLATDGDEKTMIFDRSELSTLGQTAKSKIGATLDNYGLSLSYDERTQILLSLLEEVIEGK